MPGCHCLLEVFSVDLLIFTPRTWIAAWIEDPPHPSAVACYELQVGLLTRQQLNFGDADSMVCLSQWVTLGGARMSRGCACPSAAEANALATYLVSRTYKFEEVIKPLLILLKNPKMPVFRQKALKALSSAVEEDPEMLTQVRLREKREWLVVCVCTAFQYLIAVAFISSDRSGVCWPGKCATSSFWQHDRPVQVCAS